PAEAAASEAADAVAGPAEVGGPAGRQLAELDHPRAQGRRTVAASQRQRARVPPDLGPGLLEEPCGRTAVERCHQPIDQRPVTGLFGRFEEPILLGYAAREDRVDARMVGRAVSDHP